MYMPEYRLLPDYPFSAALQDAAAAYVALVRRGVPGHKIVLIGDSSGGHLALALTRWIRDTIASEEGHSGEKAKRLEHPAGLVLFSVRPFLPTLAVPRPWPSLARCVYQRCVCLHVALGGPM